MAMTVLQTCDLQPTSNGNDSLTDGWSTTYIQWQWQSYSWVVYNLHPMQWQSYRWVVYNLHPMAMTVLQMGGLQPTSNGNGSLTDGWFTTYTQWQWQWVVRPLRVRGQCPTWDDAITWKTPNDCDSLPVFGLAHRHVMTLSCMVTEKTYIVKSPSWKGTLMKTPKTK